MSLRNVTAEASLTSTLPHLRPLPRWGSDCGIPAFSRAAPSVPNTPLILLQAALKTDKEPWEGIPGSYSCSQGLASLPPQGWGGKTTGRGQPQPQSITSLGSKSISRDFIWSRHRARLQRGI